MCLKIARHILSLLEKMSSIAYYRGVVHLLIIFSCVLVCEGGLLDLFLNIGQHNNEGDEGGGEAFVEFPALDEMTPNERAANRQRARKVATIIEKSAHMLANDILQMWSIARNDQEEDEDDFPEDEEEEEERGEEGIKGDKGDEGKEDDELEEIKETVNNNGGKKASNKDDVGIEKGNNDQEGKKETGKNKEDEKEGGEKKTEVEKEGKYGGIKGGKANEGKKDDKLEEIKEAVNENGGKKENVKDDDGKEKQGNDQEGKKESGKNKEGKKEENKQKAGEEKEEGVKEGDKGNKGKEDDKSEEMKEPANENGGKKKSGEDDNGKEKGSKEETGKNKDGKKEGDNQKAGEEIIDKDGGIKGDNENKGKKERGKDIGDKSKDREKPDLTKGTEEKTLKTSKEIGFVEAEGKSVEEPGGESIEKLRKQLTEEIEALPSKQGKENKDKLMGNTATKKVKTTEGAGAKSSKEEESSNKLLDDANIGVGNESTDESKPLSPKEPVDKLGDGFNKGARDKQLETVTTAEGEEKTAEGIGGSKLTKGKISVVKGNPSFKEEDRRVTKDHQKESTEEAGDETTAGLERGSSKVEEGNTMGFRDVSNGGSKDTNDEKIGVMSTKREGGKENKKLGDEPNEKTGNEPSDVIEKMSSLVEEAKIIKHPGAEFQEKTGGTPNKESGVMPTKEEGAKIPSGMENKLFGEAKDKPPEVVALKTMEEDTRQKKNLEGQANDKERRNEAGSLLTNKEEEKSIKSSGEPKKILGIEAKSMEKVNNNTTDEGVNIMNAGLQRHEHPKMTFINRAMDNIIHERPLRVLHHKRDKMRKRKSRHHMIHKKHRSHKKHRRGKYINSKHVHDHTTNKT